MIDAPEPTNSKAAPASTMVGRALSRMDSAIQRAADRPGLVRQFAHVALLVATGFRRVQLPRMAAALAYRTIFGLVPVLIISVVVLAAFVSDDQIQSALRSILHYSGLSQIMIDDSQATAAATQTIPGLNMGPLSMVQRAHADALQAVAVGGEAGRASQWIEKVVADIRKLPFASIGFAGLGVLFYAAISMLVEIEKAFNQVFNAPSGRSWTRRVPLYWTLLTFGSVLLIASFGVGEGIKSAAARIIEYEPTSITSPADATQAANGAENTASPPISGMLEGALTPKPDAVQPAARSDWRSTLLTSVGFLITVGISTLLLLIIYIIVPNTRVHWVPALTGAFAGALMWETGKWGFLAYLQHSVTYSKFYGPLALIPLFMLWVYATWLIVLLGLQITAAMQTYRLTATDGLAVSLMASLGLVEENRKTPRLKIIDPAAMLVVLAQVAERFGKGLTTDHSDIAAAANLDEQAVAEMLESLSGSGILIRVANADREGTYSLARPPEAISAAHVMLLADTLANARAGASPGSSPLLDRLCRQRRDALADKSLADLIAEDSQRSEPASIRGPRPGAGPPAPASPPPGESAPVAPRPPTPRPATT